MYRQWIQRSRVLALWREILRTVRRKSGGTYVDFVYQNKFGFQIYRVIPADVLEGEDIEDPATREEMRSWARHEFKRNKNVEEMQGRHEMETISQSIGYSFKG
ncbi:hypothetical protein TWF569_001251 [Orbilia oligospora]|nr:hypothetical protein TWF569_001251 [Orbilia oligospora]